MRRPKRKYSDREKAMFLLALEANAGNLSMTSRETSVPIKTLADWRDEVSGINPDVATIRNENRGDLILFLKELAWKLAEAIPGKIGEATLSQTSTSLGIVIDKAQLLSGKPTSIIDDQARVNQAIETWLNEFKGSTRDEAIRFLAEAQMPGVAELGKIG